MGNFVLSCIAVAVQVYTGEYTGDFTDSTGYGRLRDFAPDLKMTVKEE